MKRNSILLFFALVSVLFACNKKRPKQIQIPIEKISVNVAESTENSSFKDFFKSSRIIALQTSKESLVGTIKRLAEYKGRFFVLSQQTKNVLVFDSTGKFLNKIGRLGQGKGAYRGLTDFAINENDNNICLYSDRPYKLLTYNLDGKFVKEEILDDLYHGMAYAGNQLLFLNKKVDNDYRVFVKKPHNSEMEGYIPLNKSDKVFQNFGIYNPYIINSKNPYIFYPFCDTVYTAVKDQVVPKYVIDFGKNTMPASVFDKNLSARNIFDLADKNNYGYRLSNFRETKDYITFTYQRNKVVIYSKKQKKATSFTVVFNENKLPLVNYFAHDGNDNDFITMLPSYDFKAQMDIYRSEDTVWKKMPQALKLLSSNVTETSNPLLIVSTLK